MPLATNKKRRWEWLACVCGGLALLSGCMVIKNVSSTMVWEPLRFGDNVDRYATLAKGWRLAHAAWHGVEMQHPETYKSLHFERGFFKGYKDYYAFGGTGEPPPLPPRKYWRLVHRRPDGHLAVQDWFAGFRYGAMLAKLEVGHQTVQSALLAGPATLAPLEQFPQTVENIDLSPEDEPWSPDDVPLPSEDEPLSPDDVPLPYEDEPWSPDDVPLPPEDVLFMDRHD